MEAPGSFRLRGHISALLGAVLSLLFTAPALAVTTPVGTAPGSFSVNPNGGANYSIPIVAPPGTAGLTPSVSLNYDRQVKSELLGVGWSIGGLSLIQRCGSTIAIDGQKGGVNYDGNDKYCLDGQRLIAISGIYGADGAEYRTERESFQKIISYGVQGNGPASFKVWGKDGTVREYGITEDSRIEAQGKSTVRLWALNKVQDLRGNYLTVTYAEDNTNGEYRPTRIDYTGNTAVGLAPYNSVRFTYESKPDAPIQYQGGSLIKTTQRLTKIESYADNSIVRTYNLSYDNNGAAGRSRLISLQECGSDGICLPATAFQWRNGTVGSFNTTATWNGLTYVGANPDRQIFADVNGDGLPDLIHISGSTGGIVHLNNGQGGFNATASWIGLNNGEVGDNPAHQKFVDVNGDGRVDWIHINGQGGLIVYLNNGQGGFSTTPSFGNPGPNPNGLSYIGSDPARQIFADVNGDGLPDLIHISGSTGGIVHLNNGQGGFNATASWIGLNNGEVGDNPAHQKFVDVNGDGRVDWIHINGQGGLIVYLNNGQGGFSTTPSFGNPGPNPNGLSYIGSDPARQIFADVNGDGLPDLIHISGAGGGIVHLVQGPVPDQLIGITNGLGAVINITYKPLTDPSVYTKDSGSVYPYQDAQAPIYVVSRVTQSDGLGGQYGVSYQYGGARIHLTGPGWLGYRWMKTTDERSGVVSTAYFNQTYDGTHSTPSSTETSVGGVIVKRQDNFWTPVSLGGGRAYGRLDGTLEQTFELNGAPVTCISVNNTYDSFGNILTAIAKSDTSCSFTSAFTKTTTNTYSNDTANWRLGQLLTAQVTSEAPNTPALTRSSSFTYAANGLIESETVEPNSSLSLTTGYTYDSFGNRASTTVSGPDIATRTSSATYDTRGRYAVSATNALGHSATTTYGPVLGLPVAVTDANNLTATVTYDGLGRKLSETRPDGSLTTFDYAACDANCPANAVFKLTTTPTGGGAVTSYHDVLSRVLRKQSYGFSGQTVHQDTEYDTLGRVSRASHPHFVGETVHWDARAYDALGRVTAITEADGGITQTAYAGLTTTITNPLGQTSVSLKNAAGQLVRATDALNNSTTYEYDALGNLLKVTDAAGNITTMTYDLRGRKTAMNDPDMGNWSYSYNALGELTSQTDAKSQVTSMQYDVLGRLTNRTNAEGISTWTYDSAANGRGKLATVSSPGFQESYTYDNLGRATQVATVINGESFTTGTTYDAISRVDTVTYPTGFQTKNVYNTQGFLVELKNVANNASFWQASSADAHSRLTQETYGNGLLSEHIYNHADGNLVAIRTVGPLGIAQDLSYTFDLIGNLLSRTDAVQGFTENFTYDGINRLTQVAGPAPKSYTYDAIGNITYKSDVGTYLYGQNSTKPHAVTQAGPNTYTYDQNGNQISGAGRTIAYTSFNKPSQITTATASVSFAYDANQRRMTKTSASSTTVYLGKLYEKTTSAGAAEHKHYLYAANTLVGIHTQKPDAITQTRYVHTDHLLSVDTITDEAGNVVQRLSYDAHGKRRNVNGTDATSPITTSITRGFTRHEMDDEIGLINMNAREYDPVLGRFLTPDTFVQYPANTQGFNRYSYVHNNPLSYTDPSGHFLGNIFREVSRAVKKVVNEVKRTVDNVTSSDGIRMIVAAVAAYYTAGAVSAWMSESAIAVGSDTAFVTLSANSECYVTASLTVPGQAVAGAAAGFVSGGISGGDAKSAWKGATGGAISGGLFAGADTLSKTYGWNEFGRVTAKAVAGGLSNELQGRSFSDGFVYNSIYYGAQAWTDYLAQKSGLTARGPDGKLLTDGSRTNLLGAPKDASIFGPKGLKIAMDPEGGNHWYSNVPFLRNFIVDVSKVHDTMNSWMYTGGYMEATGNMFRDSMRDIYSFAGMLPAAAFTAAGPKYGSPVSGQIY